MDYKIIRKCTPIFIVNGNKHEIVLVQYKTDSGWEHLLEIEKVTNVGPNGALSYDYYWGGEWLPVDEYQYQDLSIDYIIKDCIANALCEDHELIWDHD